MSSIKALTIFILCISFSASSFAQNSNTAQIKLNGIFYDLNSTWKIQELKNPRGEKFHHLIHSGEGNGYCMVQVYLLPSPISEVDLKSKAWEMPFSLQSWLELFPQLASSINLTMINSAVTRTASRLRMHLGEFTFEGNSKFWHVRNYQAYSTTHAIGLHCGASSARSQREATQNFQKILPTVMITAASIRLD